MDWVTALGLGVLLVVCALIAGSRAWRILTGASIKIEVTWQTWFVVMVCLWLTLQAKEREVRIAAGVLALSAASRILLRLIHASIPVQTANAEVARVIGMLFFAGVCFYIVRYIRQRIARARQ